MRININDIIDNCWEKTYENKSNDFRYKPRFNEVIDNINVMIHKSHKKHVTYGLLKSPSFNFIAYNLPLIVRTDEYKKFVELWNFCIFNTLIEITTAIIVSSFELDSISHDLVKNLVTSKNDPSRIISSFKSLYNINSSRLNKAEKVFLEGSLILLNIKVLIENILLKNKDKLEYAVVTKYEKLNKEINQRISEIEDSYRKTKDFKNQRLSKYEENLKQNNNKELSGNKPTKPKKENLFDL